MNWMKSSVTHISPAKRITCHGMATSKDDILTRYNPYALAGSCSRSLLRHPLSSEERQKYPIMHIIVFSGNT